MPKTPCQATVTTFRETGKPFGQSRDHFDETDETQVVIRQVCLFGSLAHAAFLLLFLALDVPSLAVLNIFSVIAWRCSDRWGKRGRIDAAISMFIAEIAIHAAVVTAVLGWQAGFQSYLILCTVVLAIHGRVKGAGLGACIAAFLITYLGLYLATGVSSSRLGPYLDLGFFTLNQVISFFFLGYTSLMFRRSSERKEQDLRVLALRDTLTGLPNRRCILRILDAEMARMEFDRKPFVLALGDIDNFKAINDGLGHDGGDLVLTQVAAILQSSLRSGDSVSRWGGEEFLMVLRAPDLPSGAIGVERLRIAVEEAKVRFEGQELKITLTLGLALVSPGDNVLARLREADLRMYRGKDRGRNVVVYEDESELP